MLAQGINLAFAKLLLENGCSVLIADLALRPEAQEVVNKYSETSGSSPRAIFQKTDVTDWNQLEQVFSVAEKEFGELDIVCPGAGVYEEVRSSWACPSYRTLTLPAELEQFLETTRNAAESRFTVRGEICPTRHQPDTPYPCNATRHLTFLGAPKVKQSQAYRSYLQHSGSECDAASAHLQRYETCHQRTGAIPGTAGWSIQHSRHRRCPRCD